MVTGAGIERAVGVVRGVQASAGAAAAVRTLADDLSRLAPATWHPFELRHTRFAPPQLVPLGTEDARRAAEALRELVRWVDDGNCHARGVVGAARIDQLLGGALQGPGEAVRGAVAVVPTSLRRTGWSFHAATAFRSAGDGRVQVVDHLLGARAANPSGIFDVDDWARLVGSDPRAVRIQHSLDNIPAGGGPLTVPAAPWQVRRMGRELARSIERG